MASGPEHYQAAEEFLRAADAMRDGYANEIPWVEVQAVSTLAQVHATLALAAATVDVAGAHVTETAGYDLAREWEQVTR